MDASAQIPAHHFVSLLNAQRGGNLPSYIGSPVQNGYGFFDSLARTAPKVIFPGLVRLGRAVVGDIMEGRSPAESASARTMEAVAETVQRGAGRRKRRVPRKVAQALPKRKKTRRMRKRKASKSVAKKSSQRKKRTNASVTLANILRRS